MSKLCARSLEMLRRSAPKRTVSHEVRLGEAVSMLLEKKTFREAKEKTGIDKHTAFRYLQIALAVFSFSACLARKCL